MTKNMTKKRNSFFKLMLSLAIVALMSFSMLLPGLANDPPPEVSVGTGSGNPAKAVITKLLTMPVDTYFRAKPDFIRFEFIFTPLGMIVDDELDTTNIGKMPPLGPLNIDFTEDDKTDIWEEDKEGGTIFAAKESADILTGIVSANWENGEGIYKYRVHEKENSITLVGKEGASYSKAWYDIEIWVEQDTTTKLYYAKYIVTRITTGEHIDEYYDPEDAEDKVDPRPGGENWKDITDLSGMIFTNSYWNSDGGGTTNPGDTTLVISKTTTGNGAELSTLFSFEVKVIKPIVMTTDPTYSAYIMEGNDVVTSPDNYSGTYGTGGVIEFKSDAMQTIKLKHGQRLVFVDLTIGTDVEVKELAHEDYAPKYKHSFDGNIEHPAQKDTDWGFPTNPADSGHHFVAKGVNTNTVDFTNTRSGAIPTGISVDDLPYIVMIGLAAAALVVLMVVRFRKNKEYDV